MPDAPTYWEVRRGTPPQLKSLYVVPPDPAAAQLWNRRTAAWETAPGVVDRALTQEWAEDAGQVRQVDRARAAELAGELGTTLPTT